MARPGKDLQGREFGKLQVLSKVEAVGHSMWVCKCECGVVKTISANNLIMGRSASCGCQSLRIGDLTRTHGATRTKTYAVWCGIKSRCCNPKNNRYQYYGARGIKVCDRWLKFENFIADMGEAPPGKSIDRIDYNGNYEPGNCRWATSKEQAVNMSTNRRIVFEGKNLTCSEWSLLLGGSSKLVSGRLSNGWSEVSAVSTPLHKEKRKKSNLKLTS